MPHICGEDVRFISFTVTNGIYQNSQSFKILWCRMGQKWKIRRRCWAHQKMDLRLRNKGTKNLSNQRWGFRSFNFYWSCWNYSKNYFFLWPLWQTTTLHRMGWRLRSYNSSCQGRKIIWERRCWWWICNLWDNACY